ncbi:MAG TPA: murein biosynthesis integral membrane protein MurJ [Candidatus Hydrothermia bacterium]|nr:murein biosynthesis integral membrane protein MurJ [Candidatus Hydrothermia bacterium]
MLQFSLATFISRIFGFFRDAGIAFLVGAGRFADIFNIAFRIPNFFRDLLAENAMQTAFIPNFVKAQEKNEDPIRFLNIIFTIFFIASVVISILGIIFSREIVLITAYGFKNIPEKFTKTIEVTRITFPYLVLVSMSALFQATLNSRKEFFQPALSPALFDLGIVAIIVIAHFFIPEEDHVVTLGYSVLFGGLLQLLYLVQRLKAHNVRPSLTLNFRHPYLKDFGRLLIPVVIAMGFSKITPFINTLIATFLKEGSVSYLTYAYRIMQLPVGLFAVGLQTVSMPSFSRIIARNGEIRDALWKSIFYSIFLTLPSSLFIIFYAEEIVRILFQRGAFTALDTINTAQALVLYTPHVVAIGISKVLLNYYFSKGDIKIPNYSVVLGSIVNVAIALTLPRILGFPSLALAVSAGTLVQSLFLTCMVTKDNPIIPLYIWQIFKVMFVSVISLIPCYFIKVGNTLLRVVLGFIAYVIVFLTIARILNFLPELKPREDERTQNEF